MVTAAYLPALLDGQFDIMLLMVPMVAELASGLLDDVAMAILVVWVRPVEFVVLMHMPTALADDSLFPAIPIRRARMLVVDGANAGPVAAVLARALAALVARAYVNASFVADVEVLRASVVFMVLVWLGLVPVMGVSVRQEGTHVVIPEWTALTREHMHRLG